MNIEKEIFKRSKIDFDKLVAYGFINDNNKYLLSKNILDNSFRIEIQISLDGEVIGKIYDLEFNEEYTNYRIKNEKGEFASNIKEIFENVLKDIKEKCTTNKYFILDQANRISDFIYDNYKDSPQFIWSKYPGYGVFKNFNNDKWYGIIININKNKIDKEDKEIEILNVKVDKDKIEELLNKKGFYRAYHMNKNNWITIILDDTVSDEEIFSLIKESYEKIK